MGRDCSPASRMSIMNGVHCQTRDTITAIKGAWESRSGWGGVSLPNSDQIQVRVPLISPYVGFSRACFQMRAAATGTTRNGAMSRVRASPRPMNFLSSSRASPSPMTRLARTTETVRTMVVKMAWRRSALVRTWM
jgi:hypothetical protein